MNTNKTPSIFDTLAQTVACPMCSAAVDAPCRYGKYDIIRQSHEVRFDAAQATPLATDDATEGPESDWLDGDYGNALAAVNGF